MDCGIDFESKLEKAGNNLLNSKQLKEALFVYSMTAEFYPESPGVWLGLGETHEKLNDLERAAFAYRKSFELDPSGEAGREGAERLKALKSKQ